MSSPVLSILICTLPARQTMFSALCKELERQWTEEVEILYDADRNMTTGAKRNRLLEQAKGEYISYCDDDDFITGTYVSSIIHAAQLHPDCIGINGVMTTNGKQQKNWFISKDYPTWFEESDVYYRHTNHLSPVKRDIALQVKFPNLLHGEDFQYSMGLRGLLMTEVKVIEPIYHYQFSTK